MQIPDQEVRNYGLLRKFQPESALKAGKSVIVFFKRFQPGIRGFAQKMLGDTPKSVESGGDREPLPLLDPLLPEGRVSYPGKNVNPSGFKELLSNTLEFDINTLLRLRSFLYLLAVTLIFLFQTHNTLAIISLSLQNEKLREQIAMTSSVITSQELKAHELHSIHNIAQDAAALGLNASSVPAVELRP